MSNVVIDGFLSSHKNLFRVQIRTGNQLTVKIRDTDYSFDGVVFHPDLKEVYCTFYDDFKKCATLISAIDSKFINIKVHNKVKKFKNKYYGKKYPFT